MAYVSSRDSIFQSTDGRITIHFAANTVSAPTAVIYVPQPITSVPGLRPVYFFSLEAYREHDWQKVAGFNKPVTIQASYTMTDLADLDESRLALYYFDTAANQWIRTPGTVDIDSQSVTATTSRPSGLYGLMAPLQPSSPAPKPLLVRIVLAILSWLLP